MPKILHIGGADSPHVLGIMEQVAKNTDFKQSLISYPVKALSTVFDETGLIKRVPIYYYNYPLFFTKKVLPAATDQHMISFVKRVLVREKPDIIHGHYLSKCSAIMHAAMVYGKKPGIVVPWSTWDIPNVPAMIERNKRCLMACNYVMCTNTKFLNSLLDFFKQPRRKALFSFPPIRLYLYNDKPPDTSVPRLLIVRKHYQDIILRALPRIISMFPNIEISAVSPVASMQLAKELKIYDRIKFLPLLSQQDFAKTIQSHNIVRSMAPDHGTSSTTIQAAYSGAVTLVHKSPWDTGMFADGVNVIKCDLTVEDMQKKLIYAITNLPELCAKFKKNNSFLKAWDAGITWENLNKAYKSLLGR